MSSDTVDLERRIGDLERQMNRNDFDMKIQALESTMRDLERLINSNSSNDSSYKIQELENKVRDLEYKNQSNSF